MAALRREIGDSAHHRREARDDAGSKVVAVGEAARQDDAGHALQVGRLVPERDRLDAGDGQGVECVHVRVGAREGDDADLLHCALCAQRALQAANCRRGRLQQLDGVGLDERIAEQLFGEAVDNGAGVGLPAGGDRQLRPTPDTDATRMVR